MTVITLAPPPRRCRRAPGSPVSHPPSIAIAIERESIHSSCRLTHGCSGPGPPWTNTQRFVSPNGPFPRPPRDGECHTPIPPLAHFGRRSLARFGQIDRRIGEPPCSLRCRRTDARNTGVGSDDQATYSTAVEANDPPSRLWRPDSLSHWRVTNIPGGRRNPGILLGRQRTDSGRRLTRALFA